MLKMWSLRVFALMAVTALAQGCMVRATDYQALKDKLAVTQASVDEYRDAASAKQDELEQLRAESETLRAQLSDREARLEELKGAPASPELAAINERLERLASGRSDIDWDPGRRKLLVRIEFDLGKAAIKPGGKSSILSIADVLKNMPAGYVAYIDGHTDNLPVKNPRTVEKFRDNFGLASARANAVRRVLGEGGVAPRKLIARSFGEHYPVAEGSTSEARARNRRVEISVVPGNAAFTPTASLVPESDNVVSQ